MDETAWQGRDITGRNARWETSALALCGSGFAEGGTATDRSLTFPLHVTLRMLHSPAQMKTYGCFSCLCVSPGGKNTTFPGLWSSLKVRYSMGSPEQKTQCCQNKINSKGFCVLPEFKLLFIQPPKCRITCTRPTGPLSKQLLLNLIKY